MEKQLTLEEKNATIRKKMLDIDHVRLEEMPKDSPWLRPFRMVFRQNGHEHRWDISRVHDSVGIVVFNISRKKLIFVRQFRPAVYAAYLEEKCQQIDVEKNPPERGLTLEVCAGIIDKDLPVVEIAQSELREEVGYEVPISAFEKIVTYRSGVGSICGNAHMYYVEVTDDMLIHPGGGAAEEAELIEVVEMSPSETQDYINSGEVQSPPAFLFGVLWFLTMKKNRYH